MMNRLLSYKSIYPDLGISALRIFSGFAMAYSHGWGKLEKAMSGDFGFADVFGMGETVSLLLAIFAEVVCAFLVSIGLFTRIALIPLIITMLVAVFVIHADDPFSKQEFGLLYLVSYFTLFFTGPGNFSFDKLLMKR